MIVFVGRPKGEHIYVDVLLNQGGDNESVSAGSPLMLTLDQWHYLVRESNRDGETHDEDHFIWACTPDEYAMRPGRSWRLPTSASNQERKP